MKESSLAVITGANGDMGMCITRAVAAAGWKVVMACNNPEAAEPKRQALIEQTGNPHIEIEPLELRSMQNVAELAERIGRRPEPVGLLMNNAGVMPPHTSITADGFQHTVSVNYMGPYLLSRLLLPRMERGARIVNMISCTYAIGRIRLPDFFVNGGERHYHRIPVYSNTKLALLLFTRELAERTVDQGIRVNAADPGIVNTKFIHLDAWFDPLTDCLFRPLIRSAEKGASTAVDLLLNPARKEVTGQAFANCKPIRLGEKYLHHPLQHPLWKATEERLAPWLRKD